MAGSRNKTKSQLTVFTGSLFSRTITTTTDIMVMSRRLLNTIQYHSSARHMEKIPGSIKYTVPLSNKYVSDCEFM